MWLIDQLYKKTGILKALDRCRKTRKTLEEISVNIFVKENETGTCKMLCVNSHVFLVAGMAMR